MRHARAHVATAAAGLAALVAFTLSWSRIDPWLPPVTAEDAAERAPPRLPGPTPASALLSTPQAVTTGPTILEPVQRTAVVPTPPPPPSHEPGSLLVLASHGATGRPAQGMNLRVVPLEETTRPSRGPRIVTRMIGNSDGRPAHFATAVALARARVAADGTAIFANLPAGTHVLRNDRHSPDLAVHIEPGTTTTVEYLVPPGVRVEGVVVRPDGSPIPGALVESWPKDGEVEIEPLATTDWAGRFVLVDVLAGSRYGVRAEEHFASQEVGIGSAPLQTDRIVLEPAACALEGYVVTGSMAPIEGAVVWVGARGNYGPRSLWTRTDSFGHFRLFGLDCDELPVHVQAAGYQERRCKAVVEAPVQLVLEPNPTPVR